MIVELHAKSDVGRVRRGNEDNFLVLDLSSQKTWTGSDGSEAPEELKKLDLGEQGLVLVVSDGMGGALAGDVASRMAVDSVREMRWERLENGCDPNHTGRLPPDDLSMQPGDPPQTQETHAARAERLSQEPTLRATC